MGDTRRKSDHTDWVTAELHNLQEDRALWSLADMHMRDWCSHFKKAQPADPGEKIALRCAFAPAARELLAKLLTMPVADRRAVAHRLFPKPEPTNG